MLDQPLPFMSAPLVGSSQKGIAPHIDLPHRYGSPILSISLLSGTVFLLRRRRDSRQALLTGAEPQSTATKHGLHLENTPSPLSRSAASSGGTARPVDTYTGVLDASDPGDWETHRFVLPARSVLILDGEARYDWQHGIEPLSADRVLVDQTTESAVAEGADQEPETEWRLRGTRVSLTLRWMLEGGDIVGG